MMSNLFPDILNWYYLVLFIYVTIAFILCTKEKTIRNTFTASLIFASGIPKLWKYIEDIFSTIAQYLNKN